MKRGQDVYAPLPQAGPAAVWGQEADRGPRCRNAPRQEAGGRAGDAAAASPQPPPRQQRAAPRGGGSRPAPTFLVSQGFSECLLSSKLSSMGGTWKRNTGEGEQRVRAVRGATRCPILPRAALSAARAGAYLYCPRPRPENLKRKNQTRDLQQVGTEGGRRSDPLRGNSGCSGPPPPAGQGLTAAAAGRRGALRGAQVGVLRGRVHHARVQRRVGICSAGKKGHPSAGRERGHPGAWPPSRPGEATVGTGRARRHGRAAAGAPRGDGGTGSARGRNERRPRSPLRPPAAGTPPPHAMPRLCVSTPAPRPPPQGLLPSPISSQGEPLPAPGAAPAPQQGLRSPRTPQRGASKEDGYPPPATLRVPLSPPGAPEGSATHCAPN